MKRTLLIGLFLAMLGGIAWANTLTGSVGCGGVSFSLGNLTGLVGCPSAAPPASTGKILRIDGTSFILRIDGTSKICRLGGC